MDATNAAAGAAASICNPATVTREWIVICCVAISFVLARLSIDLIQTASQSTRKHFRESHHAAGQEMTTPLKKDEEEKGGETETEPIKANYGSIGEDDGENSADNSTSSDEKAVEETIKLLSSSHENKAEAPAFQLCQGFNTTIKNKTALLSLRFQCLLVVILLVVAMSKDAGVFASCVLSKGTVWTSITIVIFGAILTYRDSERERFGYVTKFFYLATVLTIAIPMTACYFKNRSSTFSGDEVVVNIMGLYMLLAIGESFFIPTGGSDAPRISEDGSIVKTKSNEGKLSTIAITRLLKPYVWPDKTADSAVTNRIRACMTWVCVIFSKGCNLSAPILLGKASTALAHQQYTECIYHAIAYAMVQFFGSLFREGQSLVYLKVAQAAFVQLSEQTFVHLHRLSLDWHLRKKLGEVMRSMDRGIAACDTLMKYLFLWLVPALVECLIVCIMFATYYSYAPLAVVVFYSVWIYIVWTIIVTLQRKKFRKAVVRSDNEWHDRATDSLINFETVKYFTAEEYERQRFGDSITKYQEGTVNVQASLSFLNITQKLILQICLALALSLATIGIRQRIDCCVEHGCESGVSECCRAIDMNTCPGMEVGDFVAVFTYTIQLFQPLNFLGTVYNAVVMAIVDLTNLSQLLAQNPDVHETPDAMILPQSNEEDEDIAVEFDNVHFHYPTQSASKGLKGVSFKMRRGTTTAIVGPTGAGKTTISRLFFRFYDVLQGAVKVNGKDVRMVTQQSLRGSIGVVPQSASMFNDTIRENIRYGRRDATQEELEQAVRDAQLLDFIEGMDDGWDSIVGDRGLKLSGGEKQRAAIARCLLKDPPFVLLDEATSALDTLTESSVQEALDRLGSQRTVLVIAHRLGTIRNADNIIVLKDGMVAESGTHDELLQLNGIYADMWNKQLHSASSSDSQDDLSEENQD
jgi:ABC-type transport system involved in Fe-S cluster assembly fused permease/ATPase subunit